MYPTSPTPSPGRLPTVNYDSDLAAAFGSHRVSTLAGILPRYPHLAHARKRTRPTPQRRYHLSLSYGSEPLPTCFGGQFLPSDAIPRGPLTHKVPQTC